MCLLQFQNSIHDIHVEMIIIKTSALRSYVNLGIDIPVLARRYVPVLVCTVCMYDARREKCMTVQN